MAFNIIIQRNESETNRVTKELVTILEITGELKTDTSIIDPVIMIEGDLSNFTTCNYISIPVFNRSYFVNNIRSVRTGLIELSCHVDVISSFADAIKANDAIIKRQETNWNLYLNDGSFKIYQNPLVLTKSFPSGFTAHEFVLAVAGS